MMANRDERTHRWSFWSANRGRTGFTLLEMLLVLAILAAVAAICFPAVDHMYQSHRLGHSANEIRTKLAATRLHAIDDGIKYQFRIEPGGRYSVAVPLEDATTRFGVAGDNEQLRTWRYQAELPQGLCFATDERARERLAFESLRHLNGASELAGVQWSAPVVFSTDGTATHVAFRVQDVDGRSVTVTIRGLTGAASVSSVQ